MTTWANLAPIAVPPWGTFHGGAFSDPTVANGVLTLAYPSGTPGGYTGAVGPATVDATTDGATVLDFDLAWNVGNDSLTPYLKFTCAGGVNQKITLTSQYFSGSSSTSTNVTFAGSTVNVPGRPTRVRVRVSGTTLVLSALGSDSAWYSPATPWSYGSTSLTGIAPEAGMDGSGNTSATGGTVTVALHQDAPATLAAPGLTLGTPTATSLPYTLTSGGGGVAPVTYALRLTTGGTTTTTPVAAGSGTVPVQPGKAYSVVAVATDSAATPATATSSAQTVTTPNPIASAAITPASSSLAGLAVQQDSCTLTYADGTTRQAVSTDGTWTSDLGTYSSSAFGRFTAPAQTNALQTCHRQFTVPANAGAGQVAIVATATTTVAAGATYTGVTINPAGPVSVPIGTTAAAPTVTVQGTNNPSQVVTWSSSNPGTVSVNASTGVYTGVAAGGAVLTATAADGVTHGTLGVVSEAPGATLDALSFVTALAPVLVPAVATAVVAQIERTGGLVSGVALDQTAIRAAYAQLVASALLGPAFQAAITAGATGVSVELANDAVSVTANAGRDALIASALGTKLSGLVVDASGHVTASNAAGLTSDQATAFAALTAALTPARAAQLDTIPQLAKEADLASGLTNVQDVLNTLPDGVRHTLDELLAAPRPALAAAPTLGNASVLDMLAWIYSVGHARNVQIADDGGVSTFGADGATLLARKNASQGATGLTTAVAGA